MYLKVGKETTSSWSTTLELESASQAANVHPAEEMLWSPANEANIGFKSLQYMHPVSIN